MNENRNSNAQQDQLHRRLSPSAKRKRRKAKMRRRIGMMLSVLVLIIAVVTVGYLAVRDTGVTTAGSAVATPEANQDTPAATETPQPTATPEPTPEPDPMANINVTWDTTGIEGYDYLIAINRAADCVTIYTKDENGNYLKPYFPMICSTGEDTPLGEYRTIEQYRWRYLFGDVYGQYAVRIVEHILFHSVPYLSQNPADLEYEEFNKLGTPASLGCIRLQVADVKWIYDNCPIGTPVVLYDDAENPGPLGKPDFTPIDVNDEMLRGWDPTDPDPANPWAAKNPRPKTEIPA